MQPVPVSVQVTALFEGPFTVAVNCTGVDCPASTVAEVGLIEMMMGRAVTVICSCAVADEAPVAAEVAVRVSTIEDEPGSAAGGVYTVEALGPAVVSDPQGPPLQPVPVSTQVTFGVEA